MYDFGTQAKNNAHYNTTTGQPPAYKLADMSVPTALFTGGKDILADGQDVSELIAGAADV